MGIQALMCCTRQNPAAYKHTYLQQTDAIDEKNMQNCVKLLTHTSACATNPTGYLEIKSNLIRDQSATKLGECWKKKKVTVVWTETIFNHRFNLHTSRRKRSAHTYRFLPSRKDNMKAKHPAHI